MLLIFLGVSLSSSKMWSHGDEVHMENWPEMNFECRFDTQVLHGKKSDVGVT